MGALHAQVRNGRLVLDEPTDLPEGTVLELEVAGSGDDLDEAERAELHAALQRAWEDTRTSAGVPAEELIDQLRSRR